MTVKHFTEEFGKEVFSKLDPFGEISVDTNYDERMAMLLLCHVVNDFFNVAFPEPLRHGINPDGLKLLIGLSNTLGYRLDQELDNTGPAPFTVMVGEITMLIMILEKIEEANEIIHLKFGSCIPSNLTEPLHEKIFETLRKSLNGSCYIKNPDSPDESLFARTTLAMIPAQGGVC